jgi:hypothetical protein
MTNLEVAPYSENMRGAWDTFVREQTPNGTIFHEQTFLSYHGKRFEDSSVVVLDTSTGEMLALVPSAVVKDEKGTGIVSHPGSTYGGVLFRKGISTSVLKSVLDSVFRYYGARYKADYFKIILQEAFPAYAPCEELPFLLWHRGFTLQTKEISCAKTLSGDPHLDYSPSRKQYVTSGKDERLGITHSLARGREEIQECYRLIEGNLMKRYGKKPTHTLEELLFLRDMYGDRISFFLSRCNGVVIATVAVFELNRKVVHNFYTAQDYELSKHKPLVGLFHYIFNYYHARGYKTFNFGISSRDKWIKWGILEFKEQFGAHILTRDTWVLNGDLSGDWPYDGCCEHA